MPGRARSRDSWSIPAAPSLQASLSAHRTMQLSETRAAVMWPICGQHARMHTSGHGLADGMPRCAQLQQAWQ